MGFKLECSSLGFKLECSSLGFKLECSSLGLASACVPCTDGMRVHFYTRKGPLYCGSPCAHSRHEIEESMLVTKKKRHTGRHTHADRHTQTHYVERRRCFLIESRYKHNTAAHTHTHTHKHTHTHTETHKHTRGQTHANPLCPAPPVFFNGACFKVCVGV